MSIINRDINALYQRCARCGRLRHEHHRVAEIMDNDDTYDATNSERYVVIGDVWVCPTNTFEEA